MAEYRKVEHENNKIRAFLVMLGHIVIYILILES